MKRAKVAGGYRALEGDIVGSADAESLEGLARRRPAECAQVLHYGAAHSGLKSAHAAVEHGGVERDGGGCSGGGDGGGGGVCGERRLHH